MCIPNSTSSSFQVPPPPTGQATAAQAVEATAKSKQRVQRGSPRNRPGKAAGSTPAGLGGSGGFGGFQSASAGLKA